MCADSYSRSAGTAPRCVRHHETSHSGSTGRTLRRPSAPVATNLIRMPLLGAADPLPHVPRRVLVAGTSGSGKTTLAARVAAVLGAPHIEIDSLFHGPGWTKRPSFDDDVVRF